MRDAGYLRPESAAKECVMKTAFRSWRLWISLCGALAIGVPASAQQPAPVVELAQPIGAQPIAGEPASPNPADSRASDADSTEGEPRLAVKPAPATPAPVATKPVLQGPVKVKVTDEPKGEAADDIEPAAPADEDDAAPKPLPTPGKDEVTPVDGSPVEVVKERYPSGVVRIEREVTQDPAGNYIAHGLWRQFDPTGRLIAEGRYLQSKKEGIWRRLYAGDEAALLATSPYSSFTPPFVSQATFSHGQLNGKWIVADAKERKVHELEFEAGERHGDSIWYYPSGQVMLQAKYDHGRASGEVIQYGPDSSIVAREVYEEGRKLAPKIDYYDAQQLNKKSEALYLHATLHVKTPDNWDTCTLAVFESRGQDEKHGPFTAWHKNGQLARQGEFRYDLPVGKFLYWYPNGQKQMEGTYVDGHQDGQWTWWHENGLKSIAGEYENATPIGVWQWWQASGKLAQKSDLSERSQVGPVPQPEEEPRQSKVKLAEPVVEPR
jgi:antitoxin component YwqK of YwqJK toxin-antitoxin module